MRFPLSDIDQLPKWQRPEALLMVMALAMPLAFSVWMALLNNFSHDVVGFTGREIGIVQAVREIPGFLAILVVYLLLFFREQRLAMISLVLLGGGTAITGLLPSFEGLLVTTLISSIGFHYYETVNQSLQLQWLEKSKAPVVMGRLAGIGSSTAFIAFGAVWIFSLPDFWPGEPPYMALYLVVGMVTVAITIFAWLAYPQFEGHVPQRREMVLKRRYWLYYLLTFFAGARRQIFVVFAGFMLVEQFGFDLHTFVGLLFINHIVNVGFAPFMGRMTARFGEKTVLVIEYTGLMCVFAGYAVVGDAWIAAALYIIDHLFFGLHFALKTYFQKIADPEDMAPTAAVAFTINHIAAVTLPWPLGLLYLSSPGSVFTLGVALAFCSLCLALLIPRRPIKGRETMLTPATAAAQPAE